MKKYSLCLLFAVIYLLLANIAGEMVFYYQEPTQYIMAQMKPVQYAKTSSGQFVPTQTNPKPAVKPALDISGIKEIQSIPVGGMRCYYARESIEELGLKGYIPMELILDSITNLVIMQMGLVKYTKIDAETGAVILEGEFGRVLKEILGLDPEGEFSMTVEHTDFIQTPGLTPKFDEDHYLLTIDVRQIELILFRDFGNPAQGYEWGVGGLLLRQYSEKEFTPIGLPHVEEKELAIDRDKITGKFYAYYTVRIIRDYDGKLLKWKQWKFVRGNPNPVWFDEGGS